MQLVVQPCFDDIMIYNVSFKHENTVHSQYIYIPSPIRLDGQARYTLKLLHGSNAFDAIMGFPIFIPQSSIVSEFISIRYSFTKL